MWDLERNVASATLFLWQAHGVQSLFIAGATQGCGKSHTFVPFFGHFSLLYSIRSLFI
jgi:hypothetical protein